VINADGSNLIHLTDYYPVWSPDGAKIAFSDERSGESEIYVMNTDGSDQTNITNTADISEYAADWQPLPSLTLPTTKAQCKNGGYEDFGFKNQGRCIASVQRAADSR
jgi:hypothetical protein